MVLGLNHDHTVCLNAWSEIKHTQNFVNIIGTGEPVLFEIPDLPISTDYRLEVISEYYAYQVYDNQTHCENANVMDLSQTDVTDITL
jgi:hypothetical protein